MNSEIEGGQADSGTRRRYDDVPVDGLVHAVREGDEAAWAEMVRRYNRLVANTGVHSQSALMARLMEGKAAAAPVPPPKLAGVAVWSPTPEGRVPRCSPWARALDVDPIGTAGSYASFCAVEWPLPWPRDIAEVPGLAPLAATMRERGMRLQAVVPAQSSAPRLRIICYRGPSGVGFAGYERTEALARPGDVFAVAMDLLDGGAGGNAAVEGVSADVLVCGHGRRDVCCGALGTALAQELEAGVLGRGIRCWRTSHTRGHRFAPTAFVFPEGTAWAFVDAVMLRRVVHRQGPLEELLPRYRGCVGLGSPALQALERAVLVDIGWDLLDRPRHGEHLGGGRVRLTAHSADATPQVWEGTVVTGRLLPVPECGRPIGEATKTEPELAVSDVRRIR